MSRTARRFSVARLATLALTLILGVDALGHPAIASAASIDGTLKSAVVSPAAFSPNGDGVRDRAVLTLVLRRTTKISVTVVDYRGAAVRRMWAGASKAAGTHRIGWDGRTGTGTLAVNGGYRFRVALSNSTGLFQVDKPVTKARSAIYPANPGAITVALDAGHGGPDPGAVRDGFTEASANLDISLRLRAMLLGAGVKVVTTRTSNTSVNRAGTDLTGDGEVGYSDELAARVEVANRARADVFLCIHNNSSTSSSARGTETYYTSRSFTAENRLLAQRVQAALMTSLRTIRRSGFSPLDRGVKQYDFYVLNGYSSSRRQRPSLMPGVLAEGLFVSNAGDRGVLRSASGRQKMAEAYYESLARYFEERTSGARYDLVAGPGATIEEGAAGMLDVKVTNTSPRAWTAGAGTLTLAGLPAVPWYDGSNAPGLGLAGVPLPGLAPGASATVRLPFAAPGYGYVASRGGRALLKVDITMGGGRLASRGVVPLQLALTITRAPTPTPTPTPSPTPTPTPTPTPSPSPTPAPEPTPSPTPEPTPTPEPSPEPSPTPTPIG